MYLKELGLTELMLDNSRAYENNFPFLSKYMTSINLPFWIGAIG
jgi:hypothetical protein